MGELDEYLDGLDAETAATVRGIYVRALELVPDAEQGKGYGMPALRYRGKPLLSVMATKSPSFAVPVQRVGRRRGRARARGLRRLQGHDPVQRRPSRSGSRRHEDRRAAQGRDRGLREASGRRSLESGGR